MNANLGEWLGIDADIFQFVVLPLLIFLARILDVSVNTLRIIFMLHGNKLLAPILGFFEALIWLIAIGQIFQNMGSVFTYLAYAGGFGMGVLVGMLIEEKLAIGKVVIRVITQKPDDNLISYLSEKGLRYSNLKADSNTGKVNILFTVVSRDHLKATLDTIRRFNPQAYYTVEGVKKVSDEDVVSPSIYAKSTNVNGM
ncbi:MAG: DUF2179 domain-containing protein [Cyclobacteriaceae bacterium]